MESARRRRLPVISLVESGGARIQEGVAALAAYGRIFREAAMSDRRSLQIAAVLGPAAGGAVYGPALGDLVFMANPRSNLNEETNNTMMVENRDAAMFVTGPEVLKAVGGPEISREELGGWHMHGIQTGQAHGGAPSDIEVVRLVRRVIGLFYHSIQEQKNEVDEDPVVIDDFVLEDPTLTMRQRIERIVDQGTLVEFHAEYGQSVVTGLARLAGHSIGIFANSSDRITDQLISRLYVQREGH